MKVISHWGSTWPPAEASAPCACLQCCYFRSYKNLTTFFQPSSQWSWVCSGKLLVICVCREVITCSRQLRALQLVSELCWEEPVLLWLRPPHLLTGKMFTVMGCNWRHLLNYRFEVFVLYLSISIYSYVMLLLHHFYLITLVTIYFNQLALYKHVNILISYFTDTLIPNYI